MLRSFFIAALVFFSAHASAIEYLVVTADGVRVRSKPSLSGRSLTMLHSGHLVVKVSESGDWTQIYFLGKEETGKTKGWMHSRFLEPEKGPETTEQTPAVEAPPLSLVEGLASLNCNKGIESGFVQNCDLHLKYRISESQNVKNIRVNCDAELLAKSKAGDVIPVPVSQTLEHQVLFGQRDFSMHIIMKADESYELNGVDLKEHSCKLLGHTG